MDSAVIKAVISRGLAVYEKSRDGSDLENSQFMTQKQLRMRLLWLSPGLSSTHHFRPRSFTSLVSVRPPFMLHVKKVGSNLLKTVNRLKMNRNIKTTCIV